MAERQLLLVKSAVEKFPHEFISLIPFAREFIAESPLLDKEYIPYGSTLMTSIAYEQGWKGLHFDLSLFNYEEAAKNRTDMLNGEKILTAYDAMVFFQKENQDSEWFIRPSEDLKHFSGQVLTAKEIQEWFADAMSLSPDSGTYYISKDLKVVLSSPKHIDFEWRWFIVDGKIINGAKYRSNGKLIENQQELDIDIIKQAQKMADKWLPDPCVVMDTALVNGKMYVIEFNCINSSGFYGHNVSEIFTALYNYHNRK